MKQKSLFKNSLFNTIYTIANTLFPFVTSIYVSRILMPIGVGRVAYAQNVASYFLLIAALGLPSYGLREFAKIREDIDQRNKLFTELFLINIISTTLSVVAFITFIYTSRGFNNEWELYFACGTTIFLNYLNIDWLYQGMEEYGYITTRSLLIKTISVGAIFLFVRNEQDYVIYALINSLATGGNYLFNVLHAKKFVRFSFTQINLMKHLKSVLVIACIVFLSSIYSKIDTTMLGSMASKEAVGYYAYAQKTLGIVITLSNAVTMTFLPRLSFYYENDHKAFYGLINKAFHVICFVAIPLSTGLFLVAPQAVDFLYGTAFTPTSQTIRWMCPLILIKSFGDLFCYQMAYSTKNEKIIVPASASATIINILINALLIPRMLQNGAVVASVISELITTCVQLIYLKKKIGFSLKFKELWISIIASIVMGIIVLLIMQLKLENNIELILSVSCGAFIYLLINMIGKNEILLQILGKVKRVLIN